MDIKKTMLYQRHIEMGAKMVEFAGYMMPLQYSGIFDECTAVREDAGLFDVSHMGEIWVKGLKALDMLEYVTTNDVSVLKPGQSQYSCLPDGNGGIVDDVIVYFYEAGKYFMVVNASNTQKVWEWLTMNNKAGAVLENASDSMSQLALQGPASVEILQKLTALELKGLKPFTFATARVSGVNEVIVSNTGYTGAGGYELYMRNEHAVGIWEAIIEAGKKYGIKPCGLASRDVLRLEMGYCLYGHEIDATTSPMEAGLGWIVKFNKPDGFIDKDRLLKQKQTGVGKKLVAFELVDKGIPRQGYDIFNLEDKLIGKVTSGTLSPSLNKAIGMGYVETAFSNKGEKIIILVRGKKISANVVSLPFLKK